MKNTEKTNTIFLYKSATWYNPLYVQVNGVSYKLNNILFYDDEKVIFSTTHGWFDSNEYSSMSFDVRLSTSKPIKKKRKLDFSKNEPFIIKSDSSYEIIYDLYLPISDFDIKYKYHKTADMILRIFYLVDDNENMLYGKENVKYLGNLVYSARNDIQEIGKKFSDYSFTPMTQKEFDENIDVLKQAYAKHIEILEYVKNYTVEDYLKELEENENIEGFI